MSPWQSLTAELDAWKDANIEATFWWRDDDAITSTEALNTLLELAQIHQAPLALAVIPAHTLPDLATVLNLRADISVLQHGFSHDNHAPPGQKKAELGTHQGEKTVWNELAMGQKALSIFNHSQPILVPPWNRIDSNITKGLARLGFQGLSTFGPRAKRFAEPHLKTTNTHVDLVDWHGTRGFVGEDIALQQAIKHLKNKRCGTLDTTEPTGLLSHHLVHDQACWTFMDILFDHLNTHSAARLISVSEAVTL